MPPRATIVEEFDDDTDLPLPSRALPNTGTRGALLEEITSDDDEDDMEIPQQPTERPVAPSSGPRSGFVPPHIPPGATVTKDKAQFKDWMQIYPIYIDAKQPYRTGCRRIAREKSVWWPLSIEIAQAVSVMGINVVHEADASHPRDWDNPGRVRINWKAAVKANKTPIKNKKQLLEVIADIIQQRRPELIPKDSQIKEKKELSPSDQHASSSSKPAPAPSKHKKRKIRTPKPPTPYPPLPQRLSTISPALVSGVLIDAVKAGMDAMKQQQVEAQGAGGGVGKGKRKVVRVRG